MIKDIIKDVDQLSKRSKEWDVRGNQDLSTSIVQDLEDTIEAHEDLLYLCANEIGYRERAIDMKFTDDTYIFMNPAFKKVDKLVLSRELDRLNGKEYLVPRYNEIELNYQDCLGSIKAAKMTDSGAIVICQAMDTIDGIFASDYGLEIIPEFDQATQEEQQEVIDEWLKSFNESYKKLDSELSNDENKKVKDAWNAAKFIEAVNTGKVELDRDEQVSNRKKKKINKFIKSIKDQKNKLRFWGKSKW